MIVDLIIAGFASSLFFALGTISLFFHLKAKRQSSLVAKAASLLPGYDCGSCSYPSCELFATAIAQKKSSAADCSFLEPLKLNELRAIAREKAIEKSSKLAFVACGAHGSQVRYQFHYSGYKDCDAAFALFGGPKLCKEACIGFGTCMAACHAAAISIESGIAVIDRDSCDGCGACIAACPTAAIKLIERDSACAVACNSKESGKRKAGYCETACTACGKCEAMSTNAEFFVRDNLAICGSPHSGNWEGISRACPTNAIRFFGGPYTQHGSDS
jgi:ferredoxin